MRTLLFSTVLIGLSMAFLQESGAQTQYWRLNLTEDEAVESGSFTAVGGKTNEDGVRFTLEQGSVTSPVSATVIATDPTQPIRLQIYKEESSPLYDEETDAEGKVLSNFRTGEEIYFKVTGESGAAYQLSVWRSPEIIMPPESPTVKMDEFLAGGGEIPSGGSNGEEAKSVTGGSGENSPFLYIILGGIFLVLLVIAFLIFRGQQLKAKASVLATSLFLTISISSTASADTVESVDLRPDVVEPGRRDVRLAEEGFKRSKQLKAVLDGLKAGSGGKLDGTTLDLSALKKRGYTNSDLDVTGAMNTILNLLELSEIIDPREKFVQPDYNPKGLPILPSRALDDYKLPTKFGIQFDALQDKINQAKAHLEANYVVLKQTELQTKRLEELADAAGGFSAIGGLYWSTVKANPNDPMNQSKAGFYKKYDEGQTSGLQFLNDALKEMGEFEYQHYKDRNWYLYYGLPYYNFMASRYVR